MTRTGPETGSILVLNGGSSLLKFGLFSVAADDEAPPLDGSADGAPLPDDRHRVCGRT
jgi:acetate kinase